MGIPYTIKPSQIFVGSVEEFPNLCKILIELIGVENFVNHSRIVKKFKPVILMLIQVIYPLYKGGEC